MIDLRKLGFRRRFPGADVPQGTVEVFDAETGEVLGEVTAAQIERFASGEVETLP